MDPTKTSPGMIFKAGGKMSGLPLTAHRRQPLRTFLPRNRSGCVRPNRPKG